MLYNLIVEQNKQLLKIIAEEQGLNYERLVDMYIPTRHDFHKFMKSYMSDDSSSLVESSDP